MKKLISILLVLLLVCALLPMSAMAASEEGKYYYRDTDGKWYEMIDDQIGPLLTDKNIIDALDKAWNEYIASLADPVPVHTDPRDHDLGWNCNTKYHWMECACGARFGEELHVDPLETENDYCKCGYHFSDNADLVTLWLKDCFGLKNFRKDVYEYETTAYSYKDVEKIGRIATRTFDSEATVELPEDLTLKEGENKFEIKVTAENKKVTKVYTVIVNKEPAK